MDKTQACVLVGQTRKLEAAQDKAMRAGTQYCAKATSVGAKRGHHNVVLSKDATLCPGRRVLCMVVSPLVCPVGRCAAKYCATSEKKDNNHKNNDEKNTSKITQCLALRQVRRSAN
eukprot:3479320-Amphidinium_carterae.1